MTGPTDQEDQSRSLKILLGLLVAALCSLAALMLVLPMASTLVENHLSPGVGLKDAALYAFIATVVVLALLAIAAGDGLLGELQFMLAAMLALFLALWIGIAWVF